MEYSPQFPHITIDPNKLGGQPCIRGLRITVSRVLDLMATYPDRAELFREFPDLTENDLRDAVAFADARRFTKR